MAEISIREVVRRCSGSILTLMTIYVFVAYDSVRYLKNALWSFSFCLFYLFHPANVPGSSPHLSFVQSTKSSMFLRTVYTHVN
jgi:hypothetical protein